MSIPSFASGAVIGTGMMGPGIALTLSLGGVRTTILSSSPEKAAWAVEGARGLLGVLAENEVIDTAAAARAAELLDCSTAFDATVEAMDLVIESAPENMELKRQLFERMDGIARPEAVLATNTSGLSITEIATRCRYPERILTTHFWNPPFVMPLVEIVLGARTSPQNAEAVRELLTRCGKTVVILKKDRPGQLGNRLQQALLREAVNIVAEGIADAEDVDIAVKTGLGIRMPVYGPFEHADVVGLDAVLNIMNYVSQDLYNEPRAPELFQRLVAAGNLGVKTGKGFYDWSKKDVDSVLRLRDRFVLEWVRKRGSSSGGH